MITVLKIKSILSVKLSKFSQKTTREKSQWDAEWRTYEVIGGGFVPINLIRLNLSGIGSVPIQKSPHFNYIKSYFTSPSYEEYLIRTYQIKEVEKHIKKFQDLYEKIKLNPSNVTVLVLTRPILAPSKGLELLDGAHRLAILASLGYSCVRVKYSY